MNHRERQFASHLEAEGKLYFFTPKKFTLLPPFLSYAPDFYVVEDNVFYEVVGTRQAFAQNRLKYEAFKKEYPNLKILFVRPDGTEYTCRSPRKKALAPIDKIPVTIKKLISKNCLSSEAREIVQFLLEKGMTISKLAIKLNVPTSNIYRFLHGKGIQRPKWLMSFKSLKTPSYGLTPFQEELVVEEQQDIQALINKQINEFQNAYPLDLDSLGCPKFASLLGHYIDRAGGVIPFAKQSQLQKKTIERWLSHNNEGAPFFITSTMALKLTRATTPLHVDEWRIWFKALAMDYPDNERYGHLAY